MRILFLILGFILSFSVSAVVYRWVDENGNVVYSDRPQPGAQVLEKKEVQTVDAPPVEPLTPRSETKESPKSGFAGYKRVAVMSPQNDEPVRENAGNVTVSVTLEPGLQTKLGHKLALFVDGAQISEPGTATQFQLNNMDRGTHTLEAKVVGPDSKVIKNSSPVTFHMLRFPG
ncbi:MAG: DUF4124 domain-containing protein [Gammaproteobacteria bacterium]